MSNFARVVDGHVVEAINLPDEHQPAQYFPADIPGSWFACDDAVIGGSTYDGAVFYPRDNTLGSAQSIAAANAAAHFSTLVAAGFTYGGKLYQIDPVSQANITGMGALALSVLAQIAGAPNWPSNFSWIAADNTLTPMTADEMYAFAITIAGFLSAGVLNRRAIKDAIAAGASVAAVQEIDVTAGYPAATA